MRIVVPIRIWFGTSRYHEDEQWFIHAVDVETDELRDFAFSGIHTICPR